MCSERNTSFDGWRDFDQAMKGEVNDGNAHYFSVVKQAMQGYLEV